MVPTKASVSKIQRFLEYSVEDRSLFARQPFDVTEDGEDQDPGVTFVGEKRVEGEEIDKEEETEGNVAHVLPNGHTISF